MKTFLTDLPAAGPHPDLAEELMDFGSTVWRLHQEMAAIRRT